MKKAFTLVELLVVIALMGLLGSISIGGYAAITRGMEIRAAIDSARSLVQAAQQRAQIDRARTYVFLFNEVLKADSDMSPGVAAGMMIAVRPTGRVSAVSTDGYICDEFNDLNQTYNAMDGGSSAEMSQADLEKAAGKLRLYDMQNGTFATVVDGIFESQIDDMDLEDDKSRTFTFHGFKKIEGEASFKPGQAYGQEFAVTRLPPGYVFSQNVKLSSATDLGLHSVKVIPLSPTDEELPSITVYARRADGNFESVGDITESKDGEQQ